MGYDTKSAYRKNPTRYCYGRIAASARIRLKEVNEHNIKSDIRLSYVVGGKSECDNNAEAIEFGDRSSEPYQGYILLMKHPSWT